jgi:magnesium transporter
VDQERAAWKAVSHGESSLALVDADGTFLGLVPPQRLLSVLLAEHDADMARLGGFIHDSEAAREAITEPVGRRFIHRIPWLVLGLLASVLAADLVGAFEGRLEDHLLLAFFIPGIVYLADAVGTQTEALIIRGLAVGVSVRKVVYRELATGVLVGACLAALLLPIVWWRWGDGQVAIAVAVSLFVACSAANAIALGLPVLMRGLSIDPAFGSGPLATVTQDLLSILIYLVVASLLVG